MNNFRFVGSGTCSIGTVKLERFGQRFSIAEDMARQALRAGVAMLSEEEFARLRFTDEQLKIWADPFMPLFEVPAVQAEADDKADFMRKRDAAQARFLELRQGLLNSIANDSAVTAENNQQEVE